MGTQRKAPGNLTMFDTYVIQDLLGDQFRHSKLLDEALCAAGTSTSEGDAEGDRPGNKRLAFVGDALIRLDVANEWYASGASTGACACARIWNKSRPEQSGSFLESSNMSSRIRASKPRSQRRLPLRRWRL